MAKAILAENSESVAQGVAETESSASRAILSSIFGIDLRTLAFFRIALALLMLADLIVRSADITAFYTERGTMPLEVARRLNDRTDWVFISPYMWVETSFGVSVLFTITALASIAMLVGWRTRLMTFIVWFLLCGLHMRNPLILHSGDTLTRLMFFWALFLPLGARWSVDGLAARQVAAGKPFPTRILSIASAALLLQIAFVYWFTILLKTGPEWRSDFTALYYALSLEQYRTALGGWILALKWPLRPLTVGTVVWELIGPILAFLPFASDKLRLFVVAGFWIFHLLGINLLMDIGSFPWVCAVAWSVFLPGLFWDKLATWWRSLSDLAVKKDMEALRESLISWRSRRIATDLQQGRKTPSLRPTMIGQAVAGVFLAIVFLWNVRTTDLRSYVPQWAPYIPSSVQWLTRIDQSWAMFSPAPLKQDGWWIIPARTTSGQDIDLFRAVRLRWNAPADNSLIQATKLDWRKPPNLADTYTNSRWCKYMMNLWSSNNQPYRIYLCRYLTWQWNENSRDGVDSVRMYFMEKDILPDYAPQDSVPRLLCEFDGTMPVEKILTKTMTVEAKANR
jgi:hypothetical protein